MSKTYEFRPEAEPKHHQIYKEYLNRLGLKEDHRADLIQRELTHEHIKAAGYATKQNNSVHDTYMTLGSLVGKFDEQLDGVPGFYIDDKTGHREQMKVAGLMIPVRDYNGNIVSLLIRNDNPKIGKSGKVENKYLAFSSNGKTKGNKVFQTTHCPIVKGLPKEVSGTTVRITEGILKADVATALSDTYCLGMHGLKVHDDLPQIVEQLEIQELIISLDAGEDDATDMIRAKGQLIKKCQEMGIDYKVELWDKKYGKGIDDVLAAGYADKIWYATEADISKILDLCHECNPENGEWVYIVGHEMFMNVHNLQMLKKSQYADRFRLQTTTEVNKLIASGFTQVDQLTFLPGGESFITEDGIPKYNEWRDPKLVPVEGDVTIFTKHIEYLFSDQQQINIALDWIAHNIQRPGEKILWALVIIGAQGVGKSFIGEAMKKMVGEYNTSSPHNDQIHEPYTGWQRKCQIIIIEELMARGRIDLMNKLKPIVTQPTTKIREMRKEAYDYPNRFNIIAFTNYDDALLVDDDDRRYCVLKSHARSQQQSYYDDLWKWLDEPKNIQALLHYFHNRDISHFRPKDKAPETSAKKDMVGMSRAPLEEWVINGIEDNAWPFSRQVIAIRHLKNQRVCPQGFEKISDQKWAQALKKAGAKPYPDQVTLSDKSKLKVWLIGDKKHVLLNASPAQLAKMYDSHSLDTEPGSQKPGQLNKTPEELISEEKLLDAKKDSYSLVGSVFDNPIADYRDDVNPVKDDEPM